MTSLQELKTGIHQALRAWHKANYRSNNLLEQLLLVQSERESLSSYGGPDTVQLAINRVLLNGLDELGKKDKLFEKILRKRFLDQETSREVGYQLNFSEDSINRRQALAIAQLAEIIWLQEEIARRVYRHALEERLDPKSYSQLFGVEKAVQTVESKLIEVGEPWVISLTGMGGIGKTAIADQAARRVINHYLYKQIAFVRAEPFSMSGRSESPERTFEQITLALSEILGISDQGPDRGSLIRRTLKYRPHLVIIDNIEEADDAALLLSHLSDWAKPTKFLITSRARPISTQATTIVALNELSLPDSMALVRHEASIRGIKEIAQAPDQQLAPLYETLGGNPLALKLAVALLEIMSLPAILSDMRYGRTQSTIEMYKHIFWKAWHSLSPEAQSLLEAMPLVGETGGTQDQLQAITKLSDAKLWQAVQELTARSLLELRGTVWERRYGIHRLTETFLNTEIIGWNDRERDN